MYSTVNSICHISIRITITGFARIYSTWKGVAEPDALSWHCREELSKTTAKPVVRITGKDLNSVRLEYKYRALPLRQHARPDNGIAF